MDQKTHKEKERIFKSIKEYDAEIRTKQEPLDIKSQEPFIFEIGVYESLGEQGGDILTWDYNEEPSEEEVKNDIRKYLKEELTHLKEIGDFMTAREEMQFNALKKLKLN